MKKKIRRWVPEDRRDGGPGHQTTSGDRWASSCNGSLQKEPSSYEHKQKINLIIPLDMVLHKNNIKAFQNSV